MQTVRSRIASRSLPSGSRLPSVREQAKALNLSV
ncbi:hypothetical protein M1697_23300, partial [Salmonella enterica subsp. enterica serovar Oranienburg]|nr:hypothetical protein [Salmonella enterica subsp. enterica serovar Oranienburg]